MTARLAVATIAALVIAGGLVAAVTQALSAT